MKLLISPTVPVPRCEGGRPEGHRLSHLRAQCRVAVPHPELQTARCRWSTPLISQSLHCTETVWCCRGPLDVCCVIQNSSRLKGLGGVFVAPHFFGKWMLCRWCVCVWSPPPNRAEGAQQLPDHGGNGVRDQRAESRVFWVHSPSGEDKVCHKSHHSKREGEGWEFISAPNYLRDLVKV